MSNCVIIESNSSREKRLRLPPYLSYFDGDNTCIAFNSENTKSMERIFRGSVVQKVTKAPDDRGRHLVKLGAIYIMIPDDELFSIGDN